MKNLKESILDESILDESILDESVLDVNKNVKSANRVAKDIEPFCIFADNLRQLTTQEKIISYARKFPDGKNYILGIDSGDVEEWYDEGDKLECEIEDMITDRKLEFLDKTGKPVRVGDYAINLSNISNVLQSFILITAITKNGTIKYKTIGRMCVDDGSIKIDVSERNDCPVNTKQIIVIPKNNVRDFVTKRDVSWI